MPRDEKNKNVSGGESAKGVQVGNSPFVWPENSPSPYRNADTPSEKFVPTPVIEDGEDSNVKRILKYVVIGLLVAFVIYTLVSICIDSPQTLFKGDSGKGHFFG